MGVVSLSSYVSFSIPNGSTTTTRVFSKPAGANYLLVGTYIANPGANNPYRPPEFAGVAMSQLTLLPGVTPGDTFCLFWGLSISSDSAGTYDFTSFLSATNERRLGAAFFLSNASSVVSSIASTPGAGTGANAGPAGLNSLVAASAASDYLINFFFTASGLSSTHSRLGDGVPAFSSVSMPGLTGGVYVGLMSVTTLNNDSSASFQWALSASVRWRNAAFLFTPLPDASSGGSDQAIGWATPSWVSSGWAGPQYGWAGGFFGVAGSGSGSTSTGGGGDALPDLDFSFLPVSDNTGDTDGLAPGDMAFLSSLTAGGPPGKAPVSGLSIIRITDATTPDSVNHWTSYPGGGPYWSMSWQSGSDWYETLYYMVEGGTGRFVDVRCNGTLMKTNDRAAPTGGELSTCFSLKSGQSQICYYISDSGAKIIQRYDTATSAISNVAPFPVTIEQTGQFLTWLQTMQEDEWIVGLLNDPDPHTIVAVRLSDGTQRAITSAQAGVAIDEPHLDLQTPGTVYISCGDGMDNLPWDLTSNTTLTTWDAACGDGQEASDDHAGVIRGGIMGSCGDGPGIYGGAYYLQRSSNYSKVRFRQGYTEWHTSGSEWYNSGYGNAKAFQSDFTSQQLLAEMENIGGDDDASWSIRAGALCAVKPGLAGGEIRFICGHGSVEPVSVYEDHARAQPSPSWRNVAFTSNMSDSGRRDVFVVRMPTA